MIQVIIISLMIQITGQHFGLQAIETKDIVVKKMVYFYLCSYAHTEPDLAIMCINTLRRDW